jgi:hypothetical protein
MIHGDLMRVVVAALLGCAGSAWGRGIPVHRDYSRPILLYDESGMRTEFDGEAPDLLARQFLRDSKAQEGLMGRETLLDMTFEQGGSVFGASSRGAGAPVPSGREDDSRRRRSEESGRNWLVQSLPLPALGQGASNAALSAMSAGTSDSSWGWLADEVAAPSPWGASDLLPEEELPATDMEVALGEDGGNPFAAERMGRRTDEAAGPATSASFPLRSESGSRPPDRVVDRTVESARERSLAAERPVSAAPSARAAAPAMADMSQTRQMLSEITSAAKPDLTTWRGGAAGGSAPGGRPVERMTAGRVNEPVQAPGGAPWPGTDARPGVAAERPAVASRTTWQGGWSAQPLGGGALSSYGATPAPAPAVVTPATRPVPRGVPGGGAKPGWQ